MHGNCMDNELHLQTYEKRGIFWKCLLEEEELLAHVCEVLRTCFMRNVTREY